MNQQKQNPVNIIIILASVIIVALLIANLVLSVSGGTSTTEILSGVIQDPLVFTIFASILTFLIVDRWRKLETELTEIRQNQVSELNEIRSHAKEYLNSRVEGSTNRAQAIESKINSLQEEHPWIASITELDLIPHIPSCRVVLRTAYKLIAQNRISLAYEYIFSYTEAYRNQMKLNKEDTAKLKLIGSVDDFIDLVEFCERVLGDEYLGLLIASEGYRNIGNEAMLPDYLRRLTRHGHYADTTLIANLLKSKVDINWFVRQIDRLFGKKSNQRTSFVVRGLAALAIYEAVSGNSKQSYRYLNRAKLTGKNMNVDLYLDCSEAEMHVIFGNYEEAFDTLRDFSSDEATDDTIYEAARVYRSLGRIDLSETLLRKLETMRGYTLQQSVAGLTEEYVRAGTHIIGQNSNHKSRTTEIVIEKDIQSEYASSPDTNPNKRTLGE